MIVYLELQNMAADDMARHIPAQVMAEAQKNHDAFEAYVVAHPGESQSTVIDPETGASKGKIFKWFSGVISKIKDFMRPGLPVFYLHNTDNSTSGRKKIGEVVATIMDASNRVISIVRRFASDLNIKTDVASFEAPIFIPRQAPQGHEIQPKNIGQITGLALANSADSKPAFAGAYREAYLQCLREEVNMPELTKENVFKFIQDEKISPLDLYTPETLLRLDPIQEELSKKKGSDNLFHEAQRYKSELAASRAKHEEEKAEMQKKIDTQGTEILTFKTEKVYSQELIKRDKLTPQQKKYIEMEGKGIQIKPDVDIATQVNAHFDTLLSKYETLGKEVFSVPGEEKKDIADPGGPAGDINPLIPQG
jgi:hypothetical protein